MMNLLMIGKKAVQLNEQQLQVTGANISNVNTAGYSRVRLVQQDSDSIASGTLNMPTGAEMVRIERMRDQLLDVNYRNENTDLGTYKEMSTRLQSLDASLQEPGDYGLTSKLNEFWDSWESLANNPTDPVHRYNMLEKVDVLAGGFYRLNEIINDKHEECNTLLKSSVASVNSIADEIASLNRSIYEQETNGQEATSLRDRLDTLLDELSQFGDVSVHNRGGDGSMVVYFGSGELVKHDQARHLRTETGEVDGKMMVDINWEDTRSKIDGLSSGQLVGVMKLRDEYLADYQTQLDNLAVNLSRAVNAIHRQGYDLGNPPSSGRDLFASDITGAADFRLADGMADHPEWVAASMGGEEADNRIALQIADLKNQRIVDGRSTINEAYASLLGNIGRDTANAVNQATALTNSTQQINNYRESVKGVSLNEESANLIKFQQSFQAASKIVQAANELLDTIMSLVR